MRKICAVHIIHINRYINKSFVYYLHIHIYFCLFMFLLIYVIVYLCIIIRNNAKLLYIYAIFMQDNVYLYNDMNYKGIGELQEWILKLS